MPSPLKHSNQHYAQVYGVSLRTIARYKAKGYPLDDEATTRLCIQNDRRGLPLPPSVTGASANPQTANTASDALGLAGSISRLQQQEKAAHEEYVFALQSNNDVLAGVRLKTWTALAEQLRKTELSTPEVQEANKNSVPIADVQKALYETFLRLRQDLDTLPRRIALELIGKDEIEIRAIIQTEIEQIISALYQCKYLEGGSQDGASV